MKVGMICFSLTGLETGERLKRGYEQKGYEVTLAGKSRYLPEPMEESIGEWTGRQFQEADGIVFIGACGIAVRHIAPFVVNKKQDPAVLVMDECGRFVISLLSGHLGGANDLTREAAGILGGTPVITTATDVHGRFAVDVFAKKNGCGIFRMAEAKEVSAALLAGETVGFYSEFPVEGQLPEGLLLCDREGNPVSSGGQSGAGRPEIGVAVTIHRNCLPFGKTTQVVPKVVTAGIGCRKNQEPEKIRKAFLAMAERQDLYLQAVEQLASIDLKKEEPGILALSDKFGIPFVTYSGEELLAVEGEFTPSGFVKSITGVDNVCERSAVLASGHGALTEKKYAGDGVTTASAVRYWRAVF